MDPVKPEGLDPWMQRVPKADAGGVEPSGRGPQKPAGEAALATDAEAEWKPPELTETKKDKECDRPHDRIDCDQQ